MPDDDLEMNEGNDDLGGDDELLDEEEAADVPDAPPPRTAKKKGRKKKGKGAAPVPAGGKAAPRPFVESQLSQSLAKSDMGELMNRYDWDSGDYTASLRRVQPQTWDGKNIQGFIATFSERLTEDIIRDKFGGGIYDIVIRGPHPRAGGNTAYLGGLRVKVSGDPKIPRDDKHAAPGATGDFANETALFLARPQAKPPSLSQIQAAREKGNGPATGLGFVPHFDRRDDNRDKMVEMSFQAMQAQAAEASREAQRLQSRLIDEATKERRGSGMDSEVLRLMRESNEASSRAMKETFEKTVELQREAQERIERDRERFEALYRQPGGIPPEMLTTMVESHRAEMQGQVNQAQAALTEERRRHEADMNRLREHYDTRLAAVQQRIDEIQAREREAREREVRQTREEMQRMLEAEKERATRDRDALAQQHRLEIEHLKGFHEMNMKQIEGQHQSSSTIVKTTMEQRIASLEAELERTRNDLSSAQDKVQAQGDLSTQAANLKGIMSNLQSVFGAPKPELPSAAMSIPEPIEEEKGWLGTLIKFGDSKVGQTVLGTLATAFQQQMMPTAALPGYPSAPYPGGGGYGGYPSGPTVPQYPGYQPQPQVQNPFVADDEEEEEDYEEVEGTEVPLEDEPEPVQVEPSISSRIGNDGVLRAEVPPGRPSYLGAEEPISHEAPKARIVDTTAEPAKPKPQPQAAEPMPTPEQLAAQLPPEVKAQLLDVITGIEQSMQEGMPPDNLAAVVMQITPDPAQLHELVAAGPEALLLQAQAVKPGTILATRQGKKYLRAVIAAVAANLAAAPQTSPPPTAQ
jgi:hypothetical protein